MDQNTEMLLKLISSFDGSFDGAYNIRENTQCVGRQSSENIALETREDGGLDIRVKPGTKGETVYIPACVTKTGVTDLVYNNFYIGAGADIKIVAGCGLHNDGSEETRHNGVHRFYLEPGAHALYEEKHVGTGTGKGLRRINPITEIELEPEAVLEIDTTQIGGVDTTNRKTTAVLKANAKLIIHERLMTDGVEEAVTDFAVDMDGEDCGVDLISRSVAKGNSRQSYHSVIRGNTRCTGHSECDAILVDNGKVTAAPELFAGHLDAALIHEAAIGKIAGEQILKLCTLGLTEKEAEETIIDGFLQG